MIELKADSFADQDYNEKASLQGKGWAVPLRKGWDSSVMMQTHCVHSIHLSLPPCHSMSPLKDLEVQGNWHKHEAHASAVPHK